MAGERVRLLEWDRDFGIFFCTQGISNIGDAAWGVLIPLYVLGLTHNPLQVSAIAVIEVAANAVLQAPFGALADRREGRRLMLIADIGRTLITVAVPVASLLHGPVLALIYAVIVPDAVMSALFNGASGSAVPMLVPEDARAKAYAWQESFESAAWVIGPAIAGCWPRRSGRAGRWRSTRRASWCPWRGWRSSGNGSLRRPRRGRSRC